MSGERKENVEGMPRPDDLVDTYIKTYKMQAVGALGSTIRTSVPREIVEREARRKNLTIKQFIKDYLVSWLYNGFDGAWARFVPKPDKDGKEGGG